MNTQVVVLGAHRSGTSAFAGMLCRMGAFSGAPTDLMVPERTDNPTGYFERLDVTELDEALLRAMNGAWDAPPAGSMKQALRAVDFDRRARRIVRELAAHPVSVMKDPRQCLLFDQWRPLLPNPVAVIVFRNPLEISRSQTKRDGTPIDVCMALWELYLRKAWALTEGMRRRIVRHADMLRDPDGFARDVVEWLQLPALDLAKSANWIDRDLHRHRADDADLLPLLNPVQRALFDALKAADETAPALRAPLSHEAATLIEAHRPVVQRRIAASAAPPVPRGGRLRRLLKFLRPARG